MMQYSSIFNPRDPGCKQPYGAVPSGTAVTLTLRPPEQAGWTGAQLHARFEFLDNRVTTIPMPFTGVEDGCALFSCTLGTDGYLGLIWYSFRLTGPDGKTLALPEHQLTVYDGGAVVPAWFGEGMTYQIFPDRFRRTEIPDPRGMVGGRTVHTGWYEEPEWRPNEKGEIRNRDFFGGSLAGVMEKLDYLQALGVETLYFCPIFEGAENHRYGTGDYEKIDPMLGDEETFSALCQAAHRRGMHIMLDGVFNHQGFVSRYFNGDGFYAEPGAYQSQQSPYYSWYHFSSWPNQYESWWGIYSLPSVNESDESYIRYISKDENSIVRRWLRAGADGWRLDVADELPDSFIATLHQAARAEKPSAVIIGEVWEDGSNKIAYSVRRKHLLGGYLDGLMNYPFRNAVLSWLLDQRAEQFYETMETLRENYPPAAFYSAMNALGTHDTVRILTLLGTGGDGQDQSRQWRAEHSMTPEQLKLGKARLKLGLLVQFAFPGSPTVYYGDEIGMEGFEDPFNRRPYPWGREDKTLLEWVTLLGRARKELVCLRKGDLQYHKAEGPVLAFTRTWKDETVLCAANAGEEEARISVPWGAVTLDGTHRFPLHPGTQTAEILLPPMTGYLLRRLPSTQP